MSTKIYEAYRFPRGKLEEFIQVFNVICIEKVAEEAGAVVLQDKAKRDIRKRLFGKQWRSKKINYEYSGEDIELIWVIATAMQMSKLGRNDPFHLDCSFNVWVRGSYCYVIPYVANHIKLAKELPMWCQEYAYWDNSDQPEGTTQRQWDQREKVWSELALEDWDKNRLTHVALELKAPYHVGLQTLLKSINNKDDWRDRIYMAANSLFSQMEEERMGKMDKRTIKML